MRELPRRFPRFEAELDRLRGQLEAREHARQHRAEELRHQRDITEWISQARLALKNRDDDSAIAFCRQVLALDPDHTHALALEAFAAQRLGRLDQALECYDRLVRLQSSNATWRQWQSSIRQRLMARSFTGRSAPRTPTADRLADLDVPSTWSAADESERLSWRSVANEFLEEHWQKLLLCLAVLLIVVSSTVGAHLLLGDLLWQPVGKCILALCATALFAAFGAGLVRWGAERAGRMMLVATLIVVPIHFMLAGEMRLLNQVTPLRVGALATYGLVLVALVRIISGMLAPRPGARLLTAALLLLSVGSAATARGSPTSWGLQFASFQLSPLVLLASVWALARGSGARPAKITGTSCT